MNFAHSIIQNSSLTQDIFQNANPHRQTFSQMEYLQQIQTQVAAELDMIPEKEFTQRALGLKKIGPKTVKPEKSILESEFFNDPEQQRQMYLKMFVEPEVHQPTPQPILSDTSSFQRADSDINLHSDINEREDLLDQDFQLTLTQKGDTFKQNMTKKSVSFKESKILKREDLPSIAQEIIREQLGNLTSNIKQIYDKSNQVTQQIESEYTCENSKILEVLLEHIIFHWEDIMEVLIDDIIEEEVHELNTVEQKIKEISSSPKKESNLADKSIHGKYHDYRSVDVRDILKVFEEYNACENSIRSRLYVNNI